MSVARASGTRRAAIVAGLRTPFAREGTAYGSLTALDLARIVVSELLERTGLDPREVDQVVFGTVIPSLQTPNIARELVLGAGLPRTIEAYTVSQACITSYRTTTLVMRAIEAGAIDVGISGGAESASAVPIPVSRRLQRALMKARRANSLAGRIRAFRGVRPADLLPSSPSLTEYSTGETMGEAAERMAKINGITREAQDRFAMRSHRLAAQAWEQGRFAGEVMEVHVPPAYEETITRDNLLRPESDLETYGRLRPVFDRRHGTLTAGNSTPLTDGASALLLMSEEKAKALGYEPLGFLTHYAFVAVDPSDQLLIGPAYATPMALEAAGLTMEDLDLFDQHEAFAAQVLSVVQMLESEAFAREKLGRASPVTRELNWESFNVNGGSIAIGHPFAATGVRQIIQTLNELRRRGGGVALSGACAAGGMAAAVVLEAAP